MAINKTQPTMVKLADFISTVEDAGRRSDCREIAKLMRKVTGKNGKMWGNGLVGFGQYHYRYESGREGDWFLTGFAPRKQALTLYVMSGFDSCQPLMDKLGKFKIGKSCLYVKSLDDIDRSVLEQLLTSSVEHVRASYQTS